MTDPFTKRAAMKPSNQPAASRPAGDPPQRERTPGTPAPAGERIAAIARTVSRLAADASGADALMRGAERARAELAGAVDEALSPLAARPLPLDDGEWSRVSAAVAALRALRGAYERAHARQVRSGRLDTRATIPGALDSPDEALPLARALDCQARIVAALLRSRCAVPPAEWDRLCLLARHLRQSTFLDETLGDPVPLVRAPTARALFVYPLLLSLADLPARPPLEARLADRLAARLAAKVGFRIDAGGAAKENPHGPTLQLSPSAAVRLDTHRVARSLARRRAEWLDEGAAGRRALPLPAAELAALLDDLERRWCAGALVPAFEPPPARQARVRFGFPRLQAAGARDGGAAAPAGAAYEYGRWEQNTIIRLAIGGTARPRDPVAALMAEAENADWLSAGAGTVVLERRAGVPRVLPGAIALLAPGPSDPAAPVASAGPGSALQLARVERVEQTCDDDCARAGSHRVGLRPWRGAPLPVGVRIGDASGFEDAWLLPGDAAAGEPPSLVMEPGRFALGPGAVLREPSRDVGVHFAALVEQGPGFERVSLRIVG